MVTNNESALFCPGRLRQNKEVLLVQLAVLHCGACDFQSSMPADNVRSVLARLSPDMVSNVPPVTAELQARQSVSTGASKVKAPSSVEMALPTVT
jgi:hypothetical protein